MALGVCAIALGVCTMALGVCTCQNYRNNLFKIQKKTFVKNTHTPKKARRTEIRTRDSRVKVLRADHYTMQRIAVRRESPHSRPVGVLATTRLLPTGKRPYNMDVLVIIPHCTHTHPVNKAPNGTEPWQVYCAGAGLNIGSALADKGFFFSTQSIGMK